jgi:4-amino-4-deoxy-L-arabinose transferase-like glycosyltransferase
MSFALKDSSHTYRVVLLALWVLLTLWVRPWTGDLRSDPLTYACIAKDMAANHNWFAPTLQGSPYLNKPPLYFWLVAASFKIFGVSTFAAKIPSLVVATVNVFFLYWIVFRSFKDYDLAFFSAFAFETTRWIFRNFATNRPESLLVFSLLLGWYALFSLNEKDKKGPYLLGISFAIGFMSKLIFAFFLPSVFVVYGLTTKRLYQWLTWPHFYFGCLLGLALSAPWFFYFEAGHPGYFSYIIREQVVQRITQGADVNKDPLMYLKEMVMHYQPHLIFFVIGFALLWKRRRNEYFWFVFLAVIVMYLPLQVSEGKSDRYLTIVTPFMSVATAVGILRFERIKNIAKNISVYGVIPLFLLFWIVPVKVHSEKFAVVHLAEKLSKDGKVDYRETFSFMKTKQAVNRTGTYFVEWNPFSPGLEYRLVCSFYLSDSFEHWDTQQFMQWVKEGDNPVLLLTSPKAAGSLPKDTVSWIKVDSDNYHVLLYGIRNRESASGGKKSFHEGMQ